MRCAVRCASSSHRSRRRAPLFLAAALLASPALAGAASAAPAPLAVPAQCDELRDTWGIEVIRLFSTASGAMLDFRYKVLDPVKAAPIFDHHRKAYLVNEATKETLAVPTSAKTGQLRPTGTPEAGRSYYMIFSNLNRAFQKGDLVSLVVGDVLIPDLVIQ